MIENASIRCCGHLHTFNLFKIYCGFRESMADKTKAATGRIVTREASRTGRNTIGKSIKDG